MKQTTYHIIIAFLLLLVLLTSCEPEEKPIQPHKRGEKIVQQVDMMPDYRYQLFYDLGSNAVVSQNLKTDWDLGFESGTNGWHIILNTARGGATATANTSVFLNATSIENVNWRWDGHTGDLDSTAIGDYRQSQNVYFIDRGVNADGNHTGYRKMVIQHVDEAGYTIRIACLDNTGDTTVHIAKDPNVNFVSFSFQNNSVVNIEPPKNNWDLVFTQYMHIFNVEPGPYLVTGVLLNRYNVQVAVDDVKSFPSITYNNIDMYSFDDNLDVIGYNWKEFSFEKAVYNVFTNLNYVIKDTEGFYYKLHFIDFYNESGNKGAPKFEFQKL